MQDAKCWQTHLECALVEISRLQAVEREQETEIRDLKRRIEEVKRRFYFGGYRMASQRRR